MPVATEQVAADLQDMPVTAYLNNQYKLYALYTVSSRAVPHADSGLKPVQQRILYGAQMMGATPTGAAPKSQKLASTVAGELHPHGDASIADTAALMAAHYQRAKLIDGQGAFPVSTGDTPASPRYTHMRLSVPGYELVRDLKDGPVVTMVPTYDEEREEPTTLPSRFPALLVYGCPGGSMAIGWSSTIPAHNPRDVMTATRALLADPDLSDDELCSLLVGPDWGSGGIVVGSDGIRDYMLTGRGAMTVSGSLKVDGKDIVITELPPGVTVYSPPEGNKPPGGVIGVLRTAILDGKITGISDVSNLSDRKNAVNIRIQLKRGADVADVIRQIRESTPFEGTFAAQLVALDGDRIPRVWTVRELLNRFLHLRDSVVLRRSQYRKDKAESRLHLVRGLVSVQTDIDTAVRVIRESDTVDQARDGLIERFTIDAVQSDYVLSMQLRKLTRMDVLELQREDDTLSKEIASLTRLITSPAARRKVIDAELADTAKIFDGPEYERRTLLATDAIPAAVARRARVAEEGGASAQRGINPNWRIDDRGVFSDSSGELLSDGRAWCVWEDGRAKITDGKGLPSRLRDTPIAPDISGLVASGLIRAGEELLLITRNAKLLRIADDKMSVQGAAGNGVAGIKLAEGDMVIAAFAVSDNHRVLSVSEKGWKVLDLADVRGKGRGGSGDNFHPFVAGENGLIDVRHSRGEFTVDGKTVTAVKRAKATTKGALPSGVTAAEG